MSKELDQVLLDTITKVNNTSTELYDGVKTLGLKAMDVAYVEIPEIINQLLLWKLSESILFSIIFLIVMGVYIYFWRKLNKSDDTEIIIPYSILGGLFVFLPSLVFFCAGIREILYILLAPKLYLLEYVSNLIK